MSYPHDQLTRAEWADVPILSEVIAEAFHPLAPSCWLIPDARARWDVFPSYFRIFVEHAMTAGAVYTTRDRDAAAVWFYRGDGWDSQPPDYALRLAMATGRWVEWFHTFDSLLDKHHPDEPRHDHLALLAVRPDRQGQGIGTALLTAYHQYLDRDDVQLPAYLEAADAHTRLIYLQHGYADHGEPIRLPDHTLMFPMWRAARGTLYP